MPATCSRKLAGTERRARGEEFKGLFFGRRKKCRTSRTVEGRIKDVNAPPKFSLDVVFPPPCEGA